MPRVSVDLARQQHYALLAGQPGGQILRGGALQQLREPGAAGVGPRPLYGVAPLVEEAVGVPEVAGDDLHVAVEDGVAGAEGYEREDLRGAELQIVV